MAFKVVQALGSGSNKRDEKDPWPDFHRSKWVEKKSDENPLSSINSLEVVNFLFINNPQKGKLAAQATHSTDSRS